MKRLVVFALALAAALSASSCIMISREHHDDRDCFASTSCAPFSERPRAAS